MSQSETRKTLFGHVPEKAEIEIAMGDAPDNDDEGEDAVKLVKLTPAQRRRFK